jgi:hypothetical protein
LVFGKNPNAELNEHDFLHVQSNDMLDALVERAKEDPALAESLKEVVERAITYTRETGEILDIIGQDNILFAQIDGKWTYRIIDGLYPRNPKMIDDAQAAILKLSRGAGVDEVEQNILMNTFNYIRTINGLAEQLHIKDRIIIAPEGAGSESADYFHLIRENLTFEEEG